MTDNPNLLSHPEVDPQPTLDTIHLYDQLLVAIMQALESDTARSRNRLHIFDDGLTTGAMPFPGTADEALEILLDLRQHKLVIATSFATRFELTLIGHSPNGFATTVLDALAVLGVLVDIDMMPFASRTLLVYEPGIARMYLER